MPKFRKKPVVIDAIQWTGDNFRELKEAFGGYCSRRFYIESTRGELDLIIETLEGDMTASMGDWIIKGIAGELYPCKPDIFDATYEEYND